MNRQKKWLTAGLAVVGVLTLVFWAKERLDTREPVRAVERNPPGMGETKVNFEVRTSEGSFPINFTLEERTYTDDELEDAFQQGKEWLDQVWLGENESSDFVSKNLYFPTRIDSLGLAVRWETENYRWIQTDGKVTDAALDLSPLTTKITAILSYGSEERYYDYTLTVKQDPLDEDEAFRQKVLDAVQALDYDENTSGEIVLPENIDGRDIQWYEPETSVWPKFFVLGNLIVLLFYFSRLEKGKQQLKDREIGLKADYPEIVYRLVLLVGAGMTVRGAWEKITEDYQREKQVGGKLRWGYEEMETALREMNYGIAELKAYENFGRRCGSQNYMRLASLMTQQVKRGARGMNHLLMQEVEEAEILRRENARKNAEEAGTKLIFPMVLMMAVVFAVLMIPAFLSMSI